MTNGNKSFKGHFEAITEEGMTHLPDYPVGLWLLTLSHIVFCNHNVYQYFNELDVQLDQSNYSCLGLMRRNQKAPNF